MCIKGCIKVKKIIEKKILMIIKEPFLFIRQIKILKIPLIYTAEKIGRGIFCSALV
jgi:hypothetical protein